jgi:hypothetical protein
MATLRRTNGELEFWGSVCSDDDLAVAARAAAACGTYRRDDEDEDPLGGALSCFGCRYRRWTPDGFTCMKGLLAQAAWVPSDAEAPASEAVPEDGQSARPVASQSR